MAEEKVLHWDGDGDPERAGWYIVIEFEGTHDLVGGPYDSEAEALDVQAKNPS